MFAEKAKWMREPLDYKIETERIEINTAPHTDLWQRTYYHFQNDNAPVLQIETGEKYFSFIVKTDFAESHHRFDQCGIVSYGVFRFITQFWRVSYFQLGPLHLSHYWAILSVIIGIVFLVIVKRKNRKVKI